MIYDRFTFMSYQHAEKLLESKRIAKFAFQNIQVAHLANLCKAHGLHVVPTGRRPIGSTIKSDYINAILDFRRVEYSQLEVLYALRENNRKQRYQA